MLEKKILTWCQKEPKSHIFWHFHMFSDFIYLVILNIINNTLQRPWVNFIGKRIRDQEWRRVIYAHCYQDGFASWLLQQRKETATYCSDKHAHAYRCAYKHIHANPYTYRNPEFTTSSIKIHLLFHICMLLLQGETWLPTTSTHLLIGSILYYI